MASFTTKTRRHDCTSTYLDKATLSPRLDHSVRPFYFQRWIRVTRHSVEVRSGISVRVRLIGIEVFRLHWLLLLLLVLQRRVALSQGPRVGSIRNGTWTHSVLREQRRQIQACRPPRRFWRVVHAVQIRCARSHHRVMR